jgi:glycosyltransferase involved in cell wall biosynthesis
MGTTKKVLYLIDSLSSGGAQRQLVELVKGLDRSVISPSVMTYHDIPFFKNELIEADIPVICIKKNDKIGVSFLREFLLELSRLKPDFIHSFLNVPNIYARIAKVLGRVNAVVTSERNISITDRLELKLCEKLTWKLSKVIITNSYATKAILMNRIGVDANRIRVVYNGVHAQQFENANPEKAIEIRNKCKAGDSGSFLIGLVGRVVPQKNHISLLIALRKILNLRPNLRLRVGFWGLEADEFYAKLLRNKIHELGLCENVFFRGEERDIGSVYAASDLVALPSLWEGFPNVVLEAMSAKRPVIVSAIADNEKIITNGVDGFIFEKDSIESLAATVLKIIELSESERKAVGARALKKVVTTYSIEKMIERTTMVYREFGLC